MKQIGMRAGRSDEVAKPRDVAHPLRGHFSRSEDLESDPGSCEGLLRCGPTPATVCVLNIPGTVSLLVACEVPFGLALDEEDTVGSQHQEVGRVAITSL